MNDLKERQFDIRIGHFNIFTTAYYPAMTKQDFDDWEELKGIVDNILKRYKKEEKNDE